MLRAPLRRAAEWRVPGAGDRSGDAVERGVLPACPGGSPSPPVGWSVWVSCRARSMARAFGRTLVDRWWVLIIGRRAAVSIRNRSRTTVPSWLQRRWGLDLSGGQLSIRQPRRRPAHERLDDSVEPSTPSEALVVPVIWCPPFPSLTMTPVYQLPAPLVEQEIESFDCVWPSRADCTPATLRRRPQPILRQSDKLLPHNTIGTSDVDCTTVNARST
jgi:hypothetical protein